MQNDDGKLKEQQALAPVSVLGVNPVHKDVVSWIDARSPDPETRKAIMAHFEGWSDEKQFEMALDIELRKLEAFRKGVEEIFRRRWWEYPLHWLCDAMIWVSDGLDWCLSKLMR